MAIVTTNRVHYVDSAMASYRANYAAALGLSANAVIPTLRLSAFKLVGGSAAATCTISDPINGKVHWIGQAGIGLNDVQSFNKVFALRDYAVTIAGAGAVLLVTTV